MNVDKTTTFDGKLQNVWVPVKSNGMKLRNNGENGIWSVFQDEQVYKRIINAIRNAKQTILLSSFLVADELLEKTLIEQAEKGRRVYILTSTDAQLSKKEKDDPTLFDKQTVDHHIKMLNNFVGKLLCRSAEHLHAKYLLIDPVIDEKFNQECVAYISTANFTSKALKENPEIIVEITASTFPNNHKFILKQLYTFFLKGFWLEANEELLEKGKWSGITSEKNALDFQSKISLPNTSLNDTTLREKIKGYFQEPGDELFISAYTFDANHETTKQLIEYSEHNNLVLLSRIRPANYDAFLSISNSSKNSQIYSQRGIHAKFIIKKQVGTLKAIVFTANLSTLGLDSGYEIGIELDEKQSSKLLEICKYWIDLADNQLLQSVDSEFLQKFVGNSLLVQEKQQTKEIAVKKVLETRSEVSIKNIKDLQSISSQQLKGENPTDFISGNKLYLRRINIQELKLASKPKGLEENKDKVKINGKKYSVFQRKGSEAKYLIISEEKELENIRKADQSLQDYYLVIG
ncbi:MAG: phospholipase D family protein [Candidatus Heimdallarchaeota archaeon]|nr:phospholipase D family protein [Candidatus Heimdallarchaeota archaeon]